MRSHPRRVILVALLTGAPAVIVALLLLWRGDFTLKLQWTATIFILLAGMIGLFSLYERVVRPLQTLSNVLAALREGDYSLRARGAGAEDSLGLVYLEANALADTLRGQRLGAMEATGLLRMVMTEIDAAVFTFDEDGTLRLVNRGGERLLSQPSERLLGRTAQTLGLQETLQGDTPRVLERGDLERRWELRRSTFRQDGRIHYLVLLTDVSRTLQAEERQAWQRLIRVLSHEINNSLAPIRSLAGSLRDILQRGSPDAKEDLRQGLDIIGHRADALGRFMAAYARLARLPRPTRRPLEVEPWLRRVAALEQRLSVRIMPAPRTTIVADADQLDQLLINLVRNAADAVLELGKGEVRLSWRAMESAVEVLVEDDGPGIGESANLFVPFYTTKPGGSGIGLALSRQIAEAHGGTLRLENRDEGGCRAVLTLPIA